MSAAAESQRFRIFIKPLLMHLPGNKVVLCYAAITTTKRNGLVMHFLYGYFFAHFKLCVWVG